MSEIIIYVTDKEENIHRFKTVPGETVRDVVDFDLVLHDFGICGGCCCCATCHVYVKTGKYPDMEDEERVVLNAEGYDIKDNSRLACQIVLTDDSDGDEFIIAPSDDFK